MKKEQLKERIGELNLVVTEFEADGMCYMDRAVSVTQVYDLIDQLDEPEVLSQEWIEENSYNRWMLEGTMDDEDETFVSSDDLQKLLVPKQGLPEKIMIPQSVADWWERDDDSVTMYGRLRVEKKHKFDLISIFYDKGLGDYLSKVEDWIYENDSIFLDLVNGKPYEVEKEKLYYTVDEKGQTLLFKYQERGIHRSNGIGLETVSRIYGHQSLNMYQLTEKEIKDYDERYWAFAVEVAE